MAQRKGKVFVAFVDYLKAFNTVDRHNLWLCLRRKGLSRKMLNLLKSLYENVLCCVRYGHDYTEFFESLAGMKQGCLLGPKTWCPFINEVADEIRKAERHGILLSNLRKYFRCYSRASSKIGLGQNRSYGLQKRGAPCSARKMVHKRPTSRGSEFIRVSGLYTLTTKLSVSAALEPIMESKEN